MGFKGFLLNHPEDRRLTLRESSRKTKIPAIMILIGTSGYSFPDWKGVFYPAHLPARQQLNYYAEQFSTVEINTTFYQLPSPRLFAGMLKKVPRDFLFWVKINQGFTHGEGLDAQDTRRFLDALLPLEQTGQLAGLLAQFPWSFRMGEDSWERIRRIQDAFNPRQLAVEFRHDSWNHPEVYQRLQSSGLAYCIVDEPSLANMMPPVVEITSPVAYFRFHGRNSKTWYGKDPHLRYDYLYSKQELADWASRIKQSQKKARKVFVFFNNCHLGQAARNALMLREMLGQSPSSQRLF